MNNPRRFEFKQEIIYRFSLVGISLVLASLLLLGIMFLLRVRGVQASATTLYVAPKGICGDVAPCYDSIQKAVDSAYEGTSIKVAQGVYTGLGFQVLTIDKSITVTGGYTTTDWINSYSTSQPTIIDAENVIRRRAISINGEGEIKVYLFGLTVQRGYAQDGNGGGIYISNGTVEIEESNILSNTVQGGTALGGGIYLETGSLTLIDNKIKGNSATSNFPNGSGGGVYISNGTSLFEENVFQNNSSTQYGGAIAIGGTSSNIMPQTLYRNSFIENSSQYGGAIITLWGNTSLENNNFQSNFSSGSGGAIYIIGSKSKVKITNNELISNTAKSAGAMQIHDAYVKLSGNLIKDNKATAGGGAIRAGGCNLEATNNVFEGNKSLDLGGVIFADSGNYIFTNNDFSNNNARVKGGAILNQGGVITLSNNHIFSNTSQFGGAFYMELGELNISNNSVRYNSAEDSGGVIFMEDGTFRLTQNEIISNSAVTNGGAIVMTDGNIHAENDIIAKNPSNWEAIYINGGSLHASHWTLAENGNYALTINNGSASLTNTIVVSNTLGGLWGPNISAGGILFYNSGGNCGGGAICSNIQIGAPEFVNTLGFDYHVQENSTAINKGILSKTLIDIDLEPRFGQPDLGADEYWEKGAVNNIFLSVVVKN